MIAAPLSLATEPSDRERFAENGVLVVPAVLGPGECDALAGELAGLFRSEHAPDARTSGGRRDVLRLSPLARQIANSSPVRSLVCDLVGREAFPVRGLFFDKNPDANWSVPWHQDLAIAVAERIETLGFGPWSVKEGILHVQAPEEVLAGMVTVRLHLDECAATNGALRVIPGSHRAGRLDSDDMGDWTRQRRPLICEVPRGGALLMCPLLLHASSRATAPSHRRVLHVEYAAEELPNGLNWFERA